MTPESIVDLFGDGILLVIIIVSVLVVPGLLVGLVISLFQAATQINEQTLSFLPRLLTTLAALIIAGPWLVTQLTDFTHRLMSLIPGLIG